MPDHSPHQLLFEKLTTFGLNEIEARIYHFLLGREPQSILQISRELSVPRTSIYDNSNKLIDKGLVERIVHHKSQRLKAQPIESLQYQLDEQKKQTEILEKNLEFLKKNLSQSLIQHASTQVRYYEGRQGFRQMLSNVLEAEHETVGYSVFGRSDVVGEQFSQRWVQEFRTRKLRDRVITNQLPQTLHYIRNQVIPGKHQLSLQDIKYIPSRFFYISGDITIYNDIFAVCYWDEGEIVGIEIQNQQLVKTQTTIFEILWMQARPISELFDDPKDHQQS